LMQRRLERALAELRPDVVHCHNLQGFSVSAWAAADRLRIPIVQSVHDYYLACPRGTMWRRGRGNCATLCPACRLFGAPRRSLSRLPFAVTGVSHHVLDRLAAAGLFRNAASRIRVIRCNNPDGGAAGDQARSASPSAAGSVGPLRLGFLGRLVPLKSVEDLLDAVKALPPGAVTLRVAGRGEEAYEQALRARAEDGPGAGIAFLGHVAPQDLLHDIDLLVVPSIWQETLGRGIHEAWSYGVPSLVTPLGGPAELVTHGYTGFLAPGMGAEPLRQALEALLRNGWDRAAVREACLSAARAHEPDVIAGQYEAVLAAAARRAPLPVEGAGEPWPRRQDSPPSAGCGPVRPCDREGVRIGHRQEGQAG
jgi:glycosyltransferase involved in cell wall biosynthesis